MTWIPFLELFDVGVEPVESGFPQLTLLGQPVLSDFEPFGCDLIGPHPPSFLRLHQSTPLEHRQVLHERGELHVERCCQLADGGWADRELLQNLPPSRIGQGVEHIVSDCGLNHRDTSP